MNINFIQAINTQINNKVKRNSLFVLIRLFDEKRDNIYSFENKIICSTRKYHGLLKL